MDTNVIAILSDLKVGDEVIVAYVAFWGSVVPFGDLSQAFFEVGDGVLEAGHLGGMLRGPGLNSECETVDELAKLCGRDIGMGVKSGQDGTGGQGGGFCDGGPSWRGWWRISRRGREGLIGQVERIGGHSGAYGSFFPVRGAIEAKWCEESVRIKIEGVDWGVQIERVRTLTFLQLLSSRGCLRW